MERIDAVSGCDRHCQESSETINWSHEFVTKRTSDPAPRHAGRNVNQGEGEWSRMNAIHQRDGAPEDMTLAPTGYASIDRGHRRRWEHPSQRTFWNSLTAREREDLAACAQEHIFWAGSALCRQDQIGTDIMVIKSGWAKVPGNRRAERIVAWRARGDLVGERATLSSAPRSATVVALNDVCALVISADRFRAVLDDHPRIIEVLRRQQCERLAEDADGLSTHEWGDVQRRLACLLHELALRRGEYEPEGPITLSLPVSSQELADWADARPDAIGWCLNSWCAQGIVAMTSHQLTIVDASALESICRQAATRPVVPVRTGSGAHALPRASLNYSIFATDVVGFGARYRDDDDRRLVRDWRRAGSCARCSAPPTYRGRPASTRTGGRDSSLVPPDIPTVASSTRC
jgi:CRP-like cAMP-binding protein